MQIYKKFPGTENQSQGIRDEENMYQREASNFHNNVVLIKLARYARDSHPNLRRRLPLEVADSRYTAIRWSCGRWESNPHALTGTSS